MSPPTTTVSKEEPNIFVCGTRSGRHNTELRTWRHIRGQNEKHQLNYLRQEANTRETDNTGHNTQNEDKTRGELYRNRQHWSQDTERR